jgi:hypothetical protein
MASQHIIHMKKAIKHLDYVKWMFMLGQRIDHHYLV